MPSIWFDSVTIPSFPSMPGSCSTDVLIIGGGIAGILCAHMLHQKHCSYSMPPMQQSTSPSLFNRCCHSNGATSAIPPSAISSSNCKTACHL